MSPATPVSANCRCGTMKTQGWHAFCQKCYAKLPYELRRDLRTRRPRPDVLAQAKAFLDADALKQAAKFDRLRAS